MDFAIAIDKDACANLPGLDPKDARVELNDSSLAVHFGERFDADVDLAAITEARHMPDPRPQTYLTMGVSAAVNTMGVDTVSVLGSHEGLLEIGFRDLVQAHVPPPRGTPNSEEGTGDGTIMMRHLIVNLEDPDGFLRALDERLHAGVNPEGEQPERLGARPAQG